MFEDLVPAGDVVWDGCVTSKRWRMKEMVNLSKL